MGKSKGFAFGATEGQTPESSPADLDLLARHFRDDDASDVRQSAAEFMRNDENLTPIAAVRIARIYHATPKRH